MMSRRSSLLLRALGVPSALACCRTSLLGLALLVAPAVGCGGSTDTGNPPVVLGQGLRLAASEGGVTVSAGANAVPAGARVDVVNTSTGESATTTAEPDGSFAVELPGSLADEYQVYAADGSQSWRTRLTSSGSSEPEAGLDGLEFLLQPSDGFTPLPGTTVRLAFRDGEVTFAGGCNSHFGAYTQCDGKLCVSGLGSTDIGCELPLQQQDQWLAAFLTSSPGVDQRGAQLTLAGSDATLEFLDRELANPDRALVGPTWNVDTLIDGGAASSVPSSQPPTLLFGADGSLAVFTGCNTGYGSYTFDSSRLVLSEINYSERGCEGADGVVEAHVQRVMDAGELTVEIEAARLTLQRGEIGLGATTD
jgi:heat shock protein HslJ